MSFSLESLTSTIKHGTDICLHDKPSSWMSDSMCGNGFTEAGEDCDCGPTDICENKCCNATSCRFTSGSQCAMGDCCDTETCQIQNSSSVCRMAEDDLCDLAEFCDGNSEQCPVDLYVHDGFACDSDDSVPGSAGDCWGGKCRSQERQCRYLWGAEAKSGPESCYELNTMGTSNGDCGFDHDNDTHLECAYEDRLCGRLQCVTMNGFPLIGDQSLTRLAKTYTFENASPDEQHVVSCQQVQDDYQVIEILLKLKG